jgi:hypothetical protein
MTIRSYLRPRVISVATRVGDIIERIVKIYIGLLTFLICTWHYVVVSLLRCSLRIVSTWWEERPLFENANPIKIYLEMIVMDNT